MSALSAAVYLVDYTSRQYMIVGENAERVMGHPREAFLEGGLDFMYHHYHDFELMRKSIFPDEVNFLKANPTIEPENMRITKSYRFRRDTGEYSHILQQATLIHAPGQPVPVAVFGFTSDITDFAEKGKLIHKIEQYSPASGKWQIEHSKEYYPDVEPHQILSKREIEILKWVADGYGSKQIADRLCVSFNTVNTHRRNMLRKTNCRNLTELLRYAIDQKLM